MAFNFQTFKTRALTAIVFVVVMLTGLLINQWSFFILFSIIHFGCWVEYQKLIEVIDADYKNISFYHKYGVMLLGWCFMLYNTNNAYYIGHVKLLAVGWYGMLVLTVVLCLYEIVLNKNLNLKLIAYSLLGLVYISLSCGLMMGLRNINFEFSPVKSWWNDGLFLPIIIIGSMWVNDTMQYMVGSLIGKTPFSKISPKKTWEGTIGGIILCVLVMGFTAKTFVHYNFPIQGVYWFITVAIAAIFGTIGDLFESKLKRLANVKDSGSIMPGHGGFLDRFDSLLIATPFVWLFVKLLTT